MGLFYDGNHKGATCRQVCPSSRVWKAGADIHQLLKWRVTHIPRQTLPSSYFCIFRSHFCHSDCRTLLLVGGGWREESQWPEPEFVFTTHPGSLERVLSLVKTSTRQEWRGVCRTAGAGARRVVTAQTSIPLLTPQLPCSHPQVTVKWRAGGGQVGLWHRGSWAGLDTRPLSTTTIQHTSCGTLGKIFHLNSFICTTEKQTLPEQGV